MGNGHEYEHRPAVPWDTRPPGVGVSQKQYQPELRMFLGHPWLGNVSSNENVNISRGKNGVTVETNGRTNSNKTKKTSSLRAKIRLPPRKKTPCRVPRRHPCGRPQ